MNKLHKRLRSAVGAYDRLHKTETAYSSKGCNGFSVVGLLSAEVEGDAEGNLFNERFSSTTLESHKGNQSSD